MSASTAEDFLGTDLYGAIFWLFVACAVLLAVIAWRTFFGSSE